MSFKDFDELLVGFEYHPRKSDTILANRDNIQLYGEVSPGELALSNFETEGGTSNRLNRLMRQKETGQSMEKIREDDKDADKQADKEFEEGYNNFMKLYKDEVAELPSKKKTEFREAVKDIKATDKIMKKKLQSMKTVIHPVRGTSPPPIIEEIVKAKKKKVAKMTEGNFNLPKPKPKKIE
jgi:hypothetical protein